MIILACQFLIWPDLLKGQRTNERTNVKTKKGLKIIAAAVLLVIPIAMIDVILEY